MEGRIINVRRLVALDITLHGPRFIMIEFGVGTPVILAVGLALTLSDFSAFGLYMGLYLLLTGVNYVPLMVYASAITKAGSAEAEVAEYKAGDKHLVRKYSIQQLLLFLPLFVFWLAVWQELEGNQVPKPAAPNKAT